MSRRITAGNDAPFRWAVKLQGKPFDLSGKDVKVYVINSRGEIPVARLTIEGNEVSGVFEGRYQTRLGEHSLSLRINEGRPEMKTAAVANVFELVQWSADAGGSDEGDVIIAPIVVESEITAGILAEYTKKDEFDSAVQTLSDQLEQKVNKEEGKTLSTNDFTNALKAKLESLSNYDDQELREAINAIESTIDTLIGDNASKKIESFNEIIRFLEGVEDTESLEGIVAGIQQSIAKKADASVVVSLAEQVQTLQTEVESQNELIEDLQNTKIDKEADDYYPQLAVGLADNLSGVDVVDSEVNFRRSGGGAISDGVARIEAIKGNSVVWNQLAKPFSEADVKLSTVTYLENGVTSDNWPAYSPFRFNMNLSQRIGHKVLLMLDFNSENTSNIIAIQFGGNSSKSCNVGSIIIFETISVAEHANMNYISLFISAPTADTTVTLSNFRVFDLTKMFGAGNEPTTIEEFYARIPMGVDLNSYNEGEVIHMDVQSIESQGVNAWDEEWEVGSIGDNNGNLISSSSTIRSKNYIKAIGGNEYYFGYFGNAVTWGRVHYYDAEKNRIGSIAKTVNASSFIPPLNCAYMKFRMGDGYGTTYKNDITISLYHSGWKAEVDNTYKPYWADTLMFDARIKEAFPNGMMPWDKVYNKDGKGYIERAKDGKDRVDMGTLNWKNLDVTKGMFYLGVSDVDALGMKRYVVDTITPQLLSKHYRHLNTSSIESLDKVFRGPYTTAYSGYLTLKDTAYTDAATLKADLQGVILYYEPTEMEVLEYDEPFNLDYKVADFGTEEIISAQPSAAFKGRTIYQFNAVDQIRENYLAIEELKKNGGSGSITIDSALSTSSTNAVQNKVVTTTLNKKVDKVEGKGLSTNDYTTAEKNKLAGLQNYDDAEVQDKLTELSSEVEEINEKIGNLPQGASMTPITYAELVELRDNGKLVAGAFYRITDYITTTAQENTHSANHPFDVIVLALSENTLAEEAYAFQSARDTDGYFANSNLSAWKLWYSLDNDVERFAWADDENGKGVIYRMIDEWNNDLPYDFKNIQFRRKISLDEGYPQFSEEAEETWVYTFCANSYHINNDEWSELKDGSLESPYGHMSDENSSTFHHNSMKPWFMYYNGNDIYQECGKAYLNDNVFLGYWEEIGSGNEEEMLYYYAYCCFGNSFGNYCYSNSFGNNCYSNSFGNNCNYNTFGNDYNSNSFGNYCYSNSFGNYCNYNTFGNNYNSNTFGNYCYSNSFGNDYNSNTFGNNCYSNSFGNNCNSNSFSNYCYSNSFGNNCNSNSFGNNCNSNSFGNDCYSNSFGNDCNYNTFGNLSQSNELRGYYCFITFGEGVQYTILENDTSGANDRQVQNYRIANGVQGNYREKIIFFVERGKHPEVIFDVNSDGDTVEICLANSSISTVQ